MKDDSASAEKNSLQDLPSSKEYQGLGERNEVRNDDMHSNPLHLQKIDSRLREAMQNLAVERAFDTFEEKANHAKRWHNHLGLTGLVLLILALEFALGRMVVLILNIPISSNIAVAAAVIGIIPFVLTTVGRMIGIHKRWTLERFKAERVRHWKFQQFLDGVYIESLSVLDNTVPAFDKRWRDLLTELNGGRGYMLRYINDMPFTTPFTPRPYMNAHVFVEAATVYQQYRLDVQLNWFSQEREHYKEADRRTETVAGTLLFIALLAAFGEGLVCLIPAWHDIVYLNPGLLVLAIATTLLSAGVRVYRSASGVSENAERYQRVAAQLTWHGRTFSALLASKSHDRSVQNDLLNCMHDIERICHSEFVEFIRVAEKSDYFL